MNQVLLIGHVVVSLCIIGLVMMQQGKGADAGAAFGGGGGGSSGSLFGASGAGTFLSRATAIFAVIFFSTSMGLAFLTSYKEGPVDLMDVDPAMIQQESDVPFIEGTTQPMQEELPLTMDQDMPVPAIADEMPVLDTMENTVGDTVLETMSNGEAVIIDQVNQFEQQLSDQMPAMESVIEQVEDVIVNEMPIASDDIPEAAN